MDDDDENDDDGSRSSNWESKRRKRREDACDAFVSSLPVVVDINIEAKIEFGIHSERAN